VIAKASPAQRQNVLVVNGLHALCTRLSALLPLEGRLSSSRDAVSSAVTRSVSPLALSAMDACESILATMHDEAYDVASANQCSLYMRELQVTPPSQS